MLKSQDKHVCRRTCARPIRLLLERYREHLTSCGYSPRTAHVYGCAVEYFGRWLGRRQVNWPRVRQFLDHHLPTCRCPRVIRDRRFNRAALRRLLKMLGHEEARVSLPQGYSGNLLRRYQEHLATVRGLVEPTIRIHLTYTLVMLSRLGIRRGSQFAGWTPEVIEQYVSQESRRTPSKGRVVTGCTRSFLRFLLQAGLIRRDLTAAVPQVARWRLASLPAALRKEEVHRLIKAADVQTSLGRRDHAILLCMSELGLRASDVAGCLGRGERRCIHETSLNYGATGRKILATTSVAGLWNGIPGLSASKVCQASRPVGTSRPAHNGLGAAMGEPSKDTLTELSREATLGRALFCPVSGSARRPHRGARSTTRREGNFSS